MDSVNILMNIRKIVRSVNLESKRIQKIYGVSIPQLLSLIHLKARTDYQSTQKELTEFLQLNSSTVTGIVNRLEKKGLVARLPNKDDRRVTNISLTTKGLELLEKEPDLLQEKLLKNLENIPEEKVGEVKNTLEFLVKVLEIESVDASPLIMMNDPLES